VLADVDSKLAEIVVLPRFLAVTRPLTVIEAVEGEDELQVTTLVTSCDVPSEKVAFAVNCWLTSSGTLAFAGEMASVVDVAGVTFRIAVLEMEPELAVIVVVPAERPCAKPLVGALLLMVPTEVSDELQSTLDVRFCWLLSVYVPVAMNCCVVSAAILGLPGVTAIDTRAGAIVKVNEPLTEFIVAITETVPLDFAVSSPAASTVARLESDELQVTEFVKSLVD